MIAFKAMEQYKDQLIKQNVQQILLLFVIEPKLVMEFVNQIVGIILVNKTEEIVKIVKIKDAVKRNYLIRNVILNALMLNVDEIEEIVMNV